MYYLDNAEDDDVNGRPDGQNGYVDGDSKDMYAWDNFRAQYRNYVAVSSNSDVEVEVKLDEYVNWIKLDLSITPAVTSLDKDSDTANKFKTFTCTSSADPFSQSICFVTNSKYLDSIANDGSSDDDMSKEYATYLESYKNTCRVGLFTHGRAGIYDEIDYNDLDPDNQIKPTLWYNKQEPFEFEFVVNSPIGMQKIFNNLVLISNNVEPESLDISIIGDAYDFNKAGIFKYAHTTIPHDPETGILDSTALENEKRKAEFKNSNRSQNFKIVYNKNTETEIRFDTTVSRDNVLNQYVLNIHGDCRNVKDSRWGKRLGNIEYREDRWLVTLSPIMFKQTTAIQKDDDGYVTEIRESDKVMSAKIRDKWCKIRIRYRGDKLAVISSIQSLLNLSYS